MPQTEKEAEKHKTPWRLKFQSITSHQPEHPADSKQTVHHIIHSRQGSLSSAQPEKHHVPLDFTKNIPTDIPYPPFINVEGVPNFRDIGGYTSKSSAAAFSVRQGYAFRCSELSQITPKGNEVMTQTLGIRVLYDLRSEAEAANPIGKPEGLKNISTPVFRKKDLTYYHGIQQQQWATAPDASKHAGFSQGYVDWYRQIAEYGAKSAFRVVFEHIRDKPDEPFGFHCTAGKDRTGVLSALILKLCGVDNHTISWEYALTVPGMGLWEEAVEQEMVGDSMMPIRSHGGMTREEAHRVCGSRASNMEQWLKAVVEKEFGGPVKYLKDQCQFSDDDIQKMKKNLLISGDGPIKPIELPGMKDHPQT